MPGRGVQVEVGEVAALESAASVKVPAEAKCLVEVCPAPGFAEGFPMPGPRGSKHT